MPNIRVIEARPQAQKQVERKKTKCAAYARVSTSLEEQESSFEAQQTYFTNMVNANDDWELVEVYADQESGTAADKRQNFQRMIKDCEVGKIDLILTKSISRFARNTLDCLNYIRKLKKLGIPIIFSKEGINTMDGSGEVLVTILASLAQQESASISQNCQLGVHYHYLEGKACSGNHKLLGLNRTRDGSFELVPEEAAIIRRIFRDYLDGYSFGHIAERLKTDHVDGRKKTKNGYIITRNWNTNGIRDILKNEKYCGNLLLQKFYTVDFLTKKVARNNGQKEQYFVEGSHDPIIPVEIFDQVQAEMVRRNSMPGKCRYTHGMGLSSRVFCAECGSTFRRATDSNHVRWVCEAKWQKTKHPDVDCHNDNIREERLKEVVVAAFNHLPDKAEELLRLQERVRVMGIARADEMITELNREMENYPEDDDARVRIEAKLMEIKNQRAVYADKDVQIRNLLDRIAAMGMEKKGRRKEELVGACHDPEEFFRLTKSRYAPGPVTEYSDDECIRFIERIVVGEKITVIFKAGLSFELER